MTAGPADEASIEPEHLDALVKYDIDRDIRLRQAIKISLQGPTNHAGIVGQLACASVITVTLKGQQ